MSAEAVLAISSIAALTPPISEPVLAPLENVQASAIGQTPGAAQSTGFGGMVSQGLNQVNQQLMDSQIDLQRLAVGNVENLHQIMIRLEESRMTFQLAMQVRNRLLEAYQDVMKMQV